MATKLRLSPLLLVMAFIFFTAGGTGGFNDAAAGDYRHYRSDHYGHDYGKRHGNWQHYNHSNRHSYDYGHNRYRSYNRDYHQPRSYSKHHRYYQPRRYSHGHRYYQPRPRHYQHQYYDRPHYRGGYGLHYRSSGHHDYTVPLVIFGAITLGHILHD